MVKHFLLKFTSLLISSSLFVVKGNDYILDWVEIQSVNPQTETESYFGNRVALSPTGDLSVICSYGSNSNLGSAFVYSLESSGQWNQLIELVPTGITAPATFGSSAAIGTNTIAIGANGNDDSTGIVFIYSEVSGVWSQTQTLLASDGSPSSNFGFSAAMAGNILYVGAPFAGEVQNGEVYVFSDPSGTGSGWTEQAILFPTSNISTAAFGYSVSAISSTLAVGAKGDGSDNAGRVYVFNTPSNEFLTLLAPPNGDPGDLFGVSVDIQEDLLAVGASAKGLAYVFDYSGLNGESWVLEATLSAPNTVTADNFGESVSVDITNPSEPLVMVGIPGDIDGGGAYIFVGKNGLWTPQTFLTSPSNNIQQQYGTSVAIYNQTCIVSAPSASDGTGVAYFYEAHQVSPAPSAAPVPGVPSQAPTWYPSNAGTWEAEQQVLQSSPALPDSYFSVSMAFQEGGVLARWSQRPGRQCGCGLCGHQRVQLTIPQLGAVSGVVRDRRSGCCFWNLCGCQQQRHSGWCQ